jgi:hypothetical protein
LRATSSGFTKAHDVPLRKLLKLGLYGCEGRVGIALEGERFTSLGFIARLNAGLAVEKRGKQSTTKDAKYHEGFGLSWFLKPPVQ